MHHTAVPIVFFLLIAWLAWVIFSTLQRNMTAKLQTNLQMKLLEKIESGQNVLQYVETEAGRKFLNSLQVGRTQLAAPYGTILSGVRWGIMLIAFGIVFFALRSIAGDHAGAHIFIGSLAMALGVGCELAAAATFYLSRSFGLLKRDGEQ